MVPDPEGLRPHIFLRFYMAYFDSIKRISRRGRQAKRLLDNYEESMRRCKAAKRYNRQAYDGSQEEG